MKRILLSLSVLSLSVQMSFAQCTVEHKTAPCKLLEGVTEREYTVCLPQSYSKDSSRTYPILYLMHGGGENNAVWQDKGQLSTVVDSLVRRGEIEEMVIICPEGNKNNMILFDAQKWRYETFFFEEFLPYIEKTYRVTPGQRYRAIAGFSMGGGACVVYGLHHPELFSMVYNMSGYLRRQPLDFLKDDPSGEWRQQVVEDNNAVKLVENCGENQVRTWKHVEWFIDCGDKDFTLQANLDFEKALRDKKIAHELRIRSGKHDWDDWHVSMAEALKYFSKNIYKRRVIDGGGSGEFKSEAVTLKQMPDYALYKPIDMQAAVKKSGKLPVIIFAPGACQDSNAEYERILTDIASHGYFIMAFGAVQDDYWDRAFEHTDSKQYFTAYEWIEAQNKDKKSPLYNTLDMNKVGISGHSCGGAQLVAVAKDSRFKAYLMFDSGLGDMSMAGASKESLTNYHNPVLYIVGGEPDVAYRNALLDYDRIQHVPVAVANLINGGHSGTFSQRYGGSFSRMAIDWFDWQLKGKTQRKDVFINGNLKDYPGWEMKAKGF